MKKPTKFRMLKKINFAIDIAFQYGQIGGDHHKMWVIDQMVRMLCDSEEDYRKVIDCYENNGEYKWNTGIAP